MAAQVFHSSVQQQPGPHASQFQQRRPFPFSGKRARDLVERITRSPGYGCGRAPPCAPLSVNPPSPSDSHQNDELHAFMTDRFSSDFYSERTAAQAREVALGILDQALQSWIRGVTLQKMGHNQALVDSASVKLLTFGSYRLGCDIGSDSDIDAICIGPLYATRDQDFFVGLTAVLSSLTDVVTDLRCVPEARVPVMKFCINGIAIDLLYARMSSWELPENLNLCSDAVLNQFEDEESRRSLHGYRVTEKMIELLINGGGDDQGISRLRHYSVALRSIKLWAKKRGIYSNAMGYLGGVNWALLLAKVCQLYPTALPSTLLSRFFAFYSVWRWPNPIMLSEPTSIKLATEEAPVSLAHKFEVWDPRINPADGWHVMPIITPAFPCMNSSYNVCPTTLNVILHEFQRANTILNCTNAAAVGTPDTTYSAKLSQLFQDLPFFRAHKHFLQIHIHAAKTEDLLTWKGWVQSRLRHLAIKLQEQSGGALRCYTNPREFYDIQDFAVSFFMGLSRADRPAPMATTATGSTTEQRQTGDVMTIDVTRPVNMFQGLLMAHETTQKMWKKGMGIKISYLKRKDIPPRYLQQLGDAASPSSQTTASGDASPSQEVAGLLLAGVKRTRAAGKKSNDSCSGGSNSAEFEEDMYDHYCEEDVGAKRSKVV